MPLARRSNAWTRAWATPSGNAPAAPLRLSSSRRRNAGRASASASCCRTSLPIRSSSSRCCAPGLIVVNVNPLYTPRELKEQLVDSGATVIVIMENFAHKLESVIARDADPARGGGSARRFHARRSSARCSISSTRASGARCRRGALRVSRCCRRPAAVRRARAMPTPSRRRMRRRCCNTPAAPRACRRAPSSRTAISSPTPCSAAPGSNRICRRSRGAC